MPTETNLLRGKGNLEKDTSKMSSALPQHAASQLSEIYFRNRFSCFVLSQGGGACRVEMVWRGSRVTVPKGKQSCKKVSLRSGRLSRDHGNVS